MCPDRLLNTYIQSATRSIELAQERIQAGEIFTTEMAQQLADLTAQAAQLRNDLIGHMIASGVTGVKVSQIFGLTRVRVSQIAKDYRIANGISKVKASPRAHSGNPSPEQPGSC